MSETNPENALLIDELKKVRLEAQKLSSALADAWEELTLLYELAEQMRGVLDVDQAIELALVHAMDILSAEGCGILLKTEGDWELHGANCPKGREEWLYSDLAKSLAEETLRRRRGFIFNELVHHSHWGEMARIFNVFNIASVPINPGGHAQGSLIAWNQNQGEFTSRDLKLLSTIAAQTGGVIESAFLYQRLQQTFRGTIRAMAVAVDAKSPWTAGHSIRVTRYAVDLANNIGLSESEIEKVEISGLLHDIGKIGVPDSTLNKPDKLTDEEWQIMKQHPVIGYEMLKDIWQFRGDILDGVLYHHERVDGKGYPFGLKGDEIPFMGRLLAVADGFDAMTSDRPYRPGMPKERALQILMEGAGTQWDKDLVKIFAESQKSK
ncbi:MAG: HD domain-containing protein [Armatimonadetes bacterium]|nr:HD domain-containing protein [Armatimonadota bacterium]MDW8027978.1 HD domain-containing protein [Armatimonadota bacterium]